MNKKQQMFIEEYLRTWNGTQSAIYAGYSKKTARSIACTLLTNVDIKQEIESRVSENAMTTDEILARLADIARSNFEDIIDIDEKGDLNIGLKVAAEKRKLHLLKAVIPTKEGTKYEFHDPVKALELLGKAQGLFTDKVDLTSKGEKINTADGYDRAISKFVDAVREIIPGKDTE
jgi:phage terminase small subunit